MTREMTPGVLALDPSLASTGWAVFREAARPASPTSALRRLDRTGVIRTDPAQDIPYRLMDIAEAVRSLLGEYDVGRVAVEVSAVAGAYGRHGGRGIAQGVLLYHQATGAILATAAGCVGPENVIQVQADTREKEERHTYLHAQCAKAGVEVPRGPRGGALEDVWDAMWIGVRALRAS